MRKITLIAATAVLLLSGGVFMKASQMNNEKENIAFAQDWPDAYDFFENWLDLFEAWNNYYTIKWVYEVYSCDIQISYENGRRYASGSVTYKRICDLAHNDEESCGTRGIIEYGNRTYYHSDVTNYHGVGV